MTEVSEAKRYGVPATEMWARIGDPGSLSEWHPAVERTEVLDGGRARVNTVVGGARVAETILEQADRRYSFRMDEHPMPWQHFVATIQVRDDGAACLVDWQATFEPKGASEPEARQLVSEFFRAGLDAL